MPLLQRVAGAGVYLLVMSLITTLTFLTWHAVGETFINGVQPRYIIPVLPLLLLPLPGVHRGEWRPAGFHAGWCRACRSRSSCWEWAARGKQ